MAEERTRVSETRVRETNDEEKSSKTPWLIGLGVLVAFIIGFAIYKAVSGPDGDVVGVIPPSAVTTPPHALTKDELDASLKKQGEWLEWQVTGLNNIVGDVIKKVDEQGKQISALQASRQRQPAPPKPAPAVASDSSPADLPSSETAKRTVSPNERRRQPLTSLLKRRADCPS